MVNMKKMLQFMIILIIMVIPFLVSAEEIESKVSSVNGIVDILQVGKVNVTNVGYTRYKSLLASGKPGVSFNGIIANDYTRNVDFKITLNIYNKEMNVLKKLTTTWNIPAGKSINYEQLLYEEELGVSLDNIAYYSLSAEIESDVDILEGRQTSKYYLENYVVMVNVLNNNVYEVQENFKATFTSSVIPVNNKISFRHKYVREDGTHVNKRAIISNIYIDDYYTLTTEEGNRLLKIGLEDNDISSKDYQINYNYNVGKDTLKNNDEFVFYLINNNFVKIDGLDFKITMPKEFNKENIQFIDSNGIEVDNVEYEVKDNVIIGKIRGVITADSSYAIRIILDDNYFINCSSNISGLTIVSVIIPILFIIIAMLIWFINKKNNESISYNSVYFNEKINSLELGYLYNGFVKDNDIASLLFCLANKGYIEIIKNKKSYKIVKKREYDGNDRVEMSFMKELFFDKDEINRKELLMSLTYLSDVIKVKLNNKKNRKNKIFAHPIFNYKILFWVMICLIVIVNTINILIEYQPSVILFNVIASTIGYVILLKGLLSKNKIIEKVLYSLVALIMIVSPIVLTSYKAFIQDSLYLLSYIIGIVVILVIACIENTLSNRTSYGNRMLSKIVSYKKYLNNVSDKEIDREIKNNNMCLYEVLPYTLVLGISDKWIDKFRDKNINKPNWYIVDKFNLDEFYLDVMNIYSDVFIALKNNGSKE